MEKYIEILFRQLESKTITNKRCIYYVVYGGYDSVEFPGNIDSVYDVYIISDMDQSIFDDRFNVISIPSMSEGASHSNRFFKILASPVFLRFYNSVVYADGNVKWISKPDDLFNFNVKGLHFLTHNKRTYIEDEILECLKYGKLSLSQAKKIKALEVYSDDSRLLLGSVFLINRKGNLSVILNKWFDYYTIAPRDQLGLSLLFNQNLDDFIIYDFAVSRTIFSRKPHKKIPKMSEDISLGKRIKLRLIYKYLILFGKNS